MARYSRKQHIVTAQTNSLATADLELASGTKWAPLSSCRASFANKNLENRNQDGVEHQHTPRSGGHDGPHQILIRSVKSVANRSQNAGQAIDPTTDTAYNNIDTFLECMDQVDMIPDLREGANVHATLHVFFAREDCFFPDHYKTRAKALLDKFEALHWGVVPGEVVDDALMPPRNHPIWGVGAITDGLAYRKHPNGKLSHALATPNTARDANVYGNNGLAVGQWYPYQLAAFLGGAHGHVTHGIHWPRLEASDSVIGSAFSVVVAGGRYSVLNDDKWAVVFYAGTRSHANTDVEKAIEANGTKALEASIVSTRPVRVFRSSQAARWKPKCGLRYDGL